MIKRARAWIGREPRVIGMPNALPGGGYQPRGTADPVGSPPRGGSSAMRPRLCPLDAMLMHGLTVAIDAFEACVSEIESALAHPTLTHQDRTESIRHAVEALRAEYPQPLIPAVRESRRGTDIEPEPRP